ncbi:MAG: tetratricopeptide repeat protein [Proteobacteria bacterium]|nr:tetratricopeptide repeat protein [Pseudomonadota bacterium]MBU1649469.1 tetratricopeptide repeat protein [Pseudomonadota bacterium]
MAEQSAFDKQQIQESSHSDSSGLLEHLNLPPVVIRFVKKNKKNLQIGIIVVAVVVISLTLYSSYRSNRIQKASAALAVAMQAAVPERHKVLVAVATDYSGTPSAHWAKAELAHELMKDGKFKEAAEQYGAVRKKINASNPLFALLTFGLAQANEAAGAFDAATLEYKAMQKIEGYEGEGFNGLARIYEAQGNMKQALAVYEEYLSTFTGQNQNDPAKIAVDEKIARLKAIQ